MNDRLQKILDAGDALLERLSLFISTSGDECTSLNQECWGEGACYGTVIENEDDPWEMPSACDTCGEQCDCVPCADRKAIRAWLAIKEIKE